jgi:hypothetical protein
VPSCSHRQHLYQTRTGKTSLLDEGMGQSAIKTGTNSAVKRIGSEIDCIEVREELIETI